MSMFSYFNADITASIFPYEAKIFRMTVISNICNFFLCFCAFAHGIRTHVIVIMIQAHLVRACDWDRLYTWNDLSHRRIDGVDLSGSLPQP